MAPPHGFALSILRSKNTVSIFCSCAKISAAQAPDGPPPTTATLYFISNTVDEVGTLWTICLPTNDDGVNATAVAERQERMVIESFMVQRWVYFEFFAFVVCVAGWINLMDLPKTTTKSRYQLYRADGYGRSFLPSTKCKWNFNNNGILLLGDILALTSISFFFLADRFSILDQPTKNCCDCVYAVCENDCAAS